MFRRAVAVGIALTLSTGGLALAQEAASVVGMVTDESKAVLPGVTVTATEVSSGRRYFAVSDERGEYRLVNVQAGTYRIEAELSGFANSVMSNMELLVGQRATLALVMKVATLRESVTVTGESPLIDTRSSQVGGNIDRRQMEELPISGRNWMSLSMMVKGVTANDVSINSRPGTARDDQFQLNLDGQQMTQAISTSEFFGQTRMSREAIAEFQIVTNLFDVTQGRSAGLQVQAISRSGTNDLAGTMYGFFRSDTLNAADHVAGYVLPFSNQQVGGSLGGPILPDRAHYFVTYEFERQPDTFVFQPPGYTESWAVPTKRSKHSLMSRGDYQMSNKHRLMVRYTYSKDDSPFWSSLFGVHPTRARRENQDNWGLGGTWTSVLSSSAVQEVKIGNYYYFFMHRPTIPLAAQTPIYQFPGLQIGTPSNIPEEFWQDSPSFRYDLTLNRGSHELKFGSDYVRERVTGNWILNARGTMTFSALPVDIERRFPIAAWDDPSKWDLTGLDPLALFHEQTFAELGPGLPGVRTGLCPEWMESPTGCGSWSLSTPRPQFAFWVGDNWRLSRLTLNLGVRYDVDPSISAPPHINQTELVINNGLFTENVGYRNDIKDWNNWSPRVGFNYDVRGNGLLAIRGGSGLYYGRPTHNHTFIVQLQNGQRLLNSTFRNDGQPGFVLDPTRGVTNDDVVEGRVPLPPQALRVFAHDYELPTISTSMIGFQQQLGSVSAFDADLVYERGWNLGSNRDPNLLYDPVTGYNRHPTQVGRPRSDVGVITLYESLGRSERLQLATAFTRRYHDNFQAAVTYTLMFIGDDTGVGTQGYGGVVDNHFDMDLSDQFGRALDFQRHTLRMNGVYRLPWEITLAGSYFFGSGNYFQSVTGLNPFGSNAGSRLRPNGSVIPVRDYKGMPLHKVDLRVSKEVRLGGTLRVAGTAEVFNLLNHANYGAYNTIEGRSNYGVPVQNLGAAYQARSGQLGVRFSF
jgi:Carboxypeptidase regulatory-like domain